LIDDNPDESMSEASYSKLDSAPIQATLERLQDRIRERFPSSGLSRVAAELAAIAKLNESVVTQLRRPMWWLRVSAFAAMLGLLGFVAWMGLSLLGAAERRRGSLGELLQAVDSGINEVIFLALAIFFLTSLETRFKRRKALRMLHRLRSLAHILDMHQLTKDPEYVLRDVQTTASSPARRLTRYELARYLEYCSELLSLVSKLAALHAQDLQDAVVLEAVTDVESLTADLSRKVWQKITILDIASGPTQRQS
jgi:hypothetical protein